MYPRYLGFCRVCLLAGQLRLTSEKSSRGVAGLAPAHPHWWAAGVQPCSGCRGGWCVLVGLGLPLARKWGVWSFTLPVCVAGAAAFTPVTRARGAAGVCLGGAGVSVLCPSPPAAHGVPGRGRSQARPPHRLLLFLRGLTPTRNKRANPGVAGPPRAAARAAGRADGATWRRHPVPRLVRGQRPGWGEGVRRVFCGENRVRCLAG